MIHFGITEAGDAGLDLSWANKLLEGNIIITKQLTCDNGKLINLLLKNQERIILHITCTGYGGTKMEPYVPKPFKVYQGARELIKMGFPVKQMVLRIDPIIPTKKGIEHIIEPLSLFKDIGIERVRYSIIDMYNHTKNRFLKEFGELPFDGFQAPDYMVKNVLKTINPYRETYTFESCTENTPDKVGCISIKDYEILGLDTSDVIIGGFQRAGCMCCAGKTELLNNKKRCPSGCLYCYWRD